MRYRKITILTISTVLLLVAVLSGCTQNLPPDTWCEQKIKQETGTTYVELGGWERDLLSYKREFKAYSYDPTLPENEGISGGWCSGFINSDGDVTITFQS